MRTLLTPPLAEVPVTFKRYDDHSIPALKLYYLHRLKHDTVLHIDRMSKYIGLSCFVAYAQPILYHMH